jgi:hypothetical protein
MAANTIQQLTSAAYRGQMDREGLGVEDTGDGSKKDVFEKLLLMEKAKLTVFVAANLCTLVFGLGFAYSVYDLRLSEEAAQETGGANTSAKLIFSIVLGLALCSLCGIYGAVKVRLVRTTPDHRNDSHQTTISPTEVCALSVTGNTAFLCILPDDSNLCTAIYSHVLGVGGQRGS